MIIYQKNENNSTVVVEEMDGDRWTTVLRNGSLLHFFDMNDVEWKLYREAQCEVNHHATEDREEEE